MSGRIFRCPTCRRTFDLAREIPKLQAGGRVLTDEEYAAALTGSFHTCPGEGAGVDFLEAEDKPQLCATEYDWVTGKPK